MKRFIITWSTLGLLFVGTAFAGSVSDLELSPLNGGMVAKIKVADGQVRFQHQVEEPKDGKPYRVIVDVLSASHELGQRNFVELPECPVQQIRTSQYSVTPEQIVRIVFDMANAPLYQVTDEEAGYVKVIFTDRSVKPFTAWSTSSYIKNAASASPEPPASQPVAQTPQPKVSPSATDLNASAQSDKLASLGGSDVAQPTPATNSPRKPSYLTKSAAEPKTTAPSTTEKTVVTAQPPTAKSTPVVVAPSTAKPSVAATPKANKPAVMPAKPPVTPAVNPEAVVAKKEAEAKAQPKSETTTPSGSQQALAAKITAAKPTETPTPTAKPAEAKKQVVTTPAEKVVAESKAPAPSATTPSAVAQDNAEEEKRTSRFRRSPTRPSKLQGTMVAEFPKRLVIKYKTRNYRDPFATLIDDSKTYDSPIEQRVPNVEGLRLVGIIESQGGSNQALFEDKTGYSYILKSGDKVKKGYVLRVEADRVYFQIFEYGWSRTVALEIEE